MADSPSTPPTGPDADARAAAAEAAVRRVSRQTSQAEALADARRTRVFALTSISVAVMAFLICTVTGMMLTEWAMAGLVTDQSELAARMTEEHPQIVRMLHLLGGALSIVGTLLYAALHVRFCGLFARLPLTEKARHKPVTAGGIATGLAIVMAVTAVGAWVAGELMPHKPDLPDIVRGHTERFGPPTQGQAARDVAIRSEQPQPVPHYVSAEENGPLWWELHLLWLPAAFAVLTLVLLLPVWSIQRQRLLDSDIADGADKR